MPDETSPTSEALAAGGVPRHSGAMENDPTGLHPWPNPADEVQALTVAAAGFRAVDGDDDELRVMPRGGEREQLYVEAFGGCYLTRGQVGALRDYLDRWLTR